MIPADAHTKRLERRIHNQRVQLAWWADWDASRGWRHFRRLHESMMASWRRTAAKRQAERDEIERLRTALAAINDIRNSIIGLQSINWSEHIYPLVAALQAAGIEGMEYPEARKRFGTMLERTNAAEADKDQAYLERNHLVAALARLYQSGIKRTDIPDWSPDWHGCAYINLPTGQISYHYHDSQASLFEGLPPYEGEWDGHDKQTVHQRLGALASPKAPTPEA